MSLTRKLIILGLVLVIIGAFLWFSVLPSYFQNSTSSSHNVPYTSITLRDGTYGTNNTATLDFGDTEYTFEHTYFGSFIVSTFTQLSETYTPQAGDIYTYCGIEINVANVTSDYISKYIMFLVKPTVENYMASLHYTKLNITLSSLGIVVNISSGLTNETHEYAFMFVKPAWYQYELEIQTTSPPIQSKDYEVLGGEDLTASDFNIEVRVFQVNSEYMVIYVKPLY
jgi:hypothetical protein